jgi:hypothetical protein
VFNIDCNVDTPEILYEDYSVVFPFIVVSPGTLIDKINAVILFRTTLIIIKNYLLYLIENFELYLEVFLGKQSLPQ